MRGVERGRPVAACAGGSHPWRLWPVVLLLIAGGCAGEGGERGDPESAALAADEAPAAESLSAGVGAALNRVRNNRAPEARFEVFPPEGFAGLSRFRFDASFSSDDFNLAGEMFKRWDFDGDGEWDTRFSRATRTSHIFLEPGAFRPRLEIRDTGGQTDSTTGSLLTVLESCPAPDFALVDENPNSDSFGDIYQLSNYRGRRVVLWLASPSS